MADPTIVAQAREWIDRVDAGRGLSNGWRLQMIQKRFRKRDLGEGGTPPACDGTECVGTPMRIRRFVPGCPWALVDQAVRYLICKAPYSGIIYNGIELAGTYRPTLTMWTRDEQASVNEQGLKDGTYTLVQDLIEVSDCDDSETVVTGETCSYVETTEYHWDEDSPGELPGCGSECAGTGVCQGVTYAIRSNRNEDGTFDWQLVKRVAKTQHSPETVVDCDCASETRLESWDNVYGEPGAFSDDCGSPVPVPDSCSGEEPGVVRQVTVSKNDDCTYKVQVVTKESKPDRESWTDGTACRTRTSETFENERSVPSVEPAAVGETLQVSLKRNDDCTYSGSVTRTVAPDPYEYGWEDGPECRKRTTVVRKDLREEPVPPEIASGETLSYQKSRNEDCTWDEQYTVTRPFSGGPVDWRQGSACKPQHVWSYQSVAEIPEIPEAADGQYVTASIRRNEDCTYDVQYTVTEPSAEAVLPWRDGTACGPARNVTSYQNSAEMPVIPVPSAGETVRASLRRNDDCTYDGTVEVVESREDANSWTVANCMEDVTTTSVRNSRTDPSSDGTIPAGEPGMEVSASVKKNEDCTYDANYSVAVPHERKTDVVKWRSGDFEIEEMRYYNLSKPVVWNDAGSDVSVSCEFSMNKFCLYDGTVKKTRRVAWSSSSEAYTWGPEVGPWVFVGVDVGKDSASGGTIRFPTEAVFRCYIEGSRTLKDFHEYLATLNEHAASNNYHVVDVRNDGSYGGHTTCFFIAVEYRGSYVYDYDVNGAVGQGEKDIRKVGSKAWKAIAPSVSPIEGTGSKSKDQLPNKNVNTKTTG